MRQGHIAVFTPSAKGHIYPVLGICKELVDRGHRVTFATNEYGAGLVREAGVEPVLIRHEESGPNIDLPNWPVRDPRWWNIMAEAHLLLVRHAATAVSQLETFYKENPPDAIIYDNCAYAGRVIARYTNATGILFHTAFPRDRFFTWEDGVGRNPPPILEFSKALDAFYRSHGIEGEGHLWHNAALNISPMPRELQYDADSFDFRRFCFVGPCLRPHNNSWKSSGKRRRSILVSDADGRGDIEHFKEVIAALSELECNVVLSVGEKFPIERLLPLPDDFEINQRVSHLEILPHVDLWIFGGGAYSTLEALYFGVPMIALPPTPAQEVVAARIDQLGLGINLPRHLKTAETIKQSATKLLGDVATAEKVRHMQRIVKNCGGPVLAADEIEELLLARA